MVKVYGKPGCGQCIATERAMTKQGVEFQKIDVTKDERAYEHVLSLGYNQVPVVETPEEHWYGYKPEKIKEL